MKLRVSVGDNLSEIQLVDPELLAAMTGSILVGFKNNQL